MCIRDRHIRNTIGHTKVVPGLYQHLDYPDVASLAMPTPIFVINGTKDGLFELDGVKASFAKLNACYAKAGVPDHCRTQFYETPHEFNLSLIHISEPTRQAEISYAVFC